LKEISDIKKKKIVLDEIDQVKLLGFNDENLRIIEFNFDAKIIVRGNEIILIGPDEDLFILDKIFQELISIYKRNGSVEKRDVETILDVVKSNNSNEIITTSTSYNTSVILHTKEGSIKPKTEGQKDYYESALKNDIVFAIGPAGTGKTYLAVAIALAHLRDKIISKIVLARPAVEAGESLGFLPGDLLEKVDPYLKPIYDALFDMIIPSKLKKYMESEIIEVVPLAYMRGRTLNNSFVILDEAQNTFPNQMKMFLTRLGVNSKAIITGDITQIDIPDKSSSGLVQIRQILKGIEGIDFIYLNDQDIVRHRLVREIIRAYDKFNNVDDIDLDT
jgi:phosphate starvation-inducible PhoH-like protein